MPLIPGRFPITAEMIDSFKASASTGLGAGGEVTRVPGLGNELKLDVAHGHGFYTLAIDAAPFEQSWVDQTLDMTDNSHSWICVNSAGAVEEVFAHPDEELCIVLAEAVTQSGKIVTLIKYTIPLYQLVPRLHEEKHETEGVKVGVGCETTAHATPLRFAVSGGHFYIGGTEVDTAIADPATFTAWYKDNLGAWVAVPGETLIDDERYNPLPAGNLAAIPAGEFCGHTVYVTANDSGTEIHVVYAQTTHAAAILCTTLPSPPDWLDTGGALSAQVIVEKSAGAINSINNYRNVRPTALAGGALNDHHLLARLDTFDDHPRKQERSEKGNANGYASLDAGALVPVAQLPAATAITAGTISAADQAKLTALITNAVPDTRQIIAGNGTTGGGDLTANRTITVLAEDTSVAVGAAGVKVNPADTSLEVAAGLKVKLADTSLTVGAGGLSVGAISAAQHAAQTDGTLHALATTSVAGFQSAGDKVKQDRIGTQFAQTASGTVGNSNAEATLTAAGEGTLTFPAGFFVAGRSIRLVASGFFSRTSGTMTMRAKLGGVTFGDTGARSPTTETNEGWGLELEVTCRTAGGGGTAFAQGRLYMSTGVDDGMMWRMVNTTTFAVNTTLALALDLTAQWSVVNAANTITCTNLTIQNLN